MNSVVTQSEILFAYLSIPFLLQVPRPFFVHSITNGLTTKFTTKSSYHLSGNSYFILHACCPTKALPFNTHAMHDTQKSSKWALM